MPLKLSAKHWKAVFIHLFLQSVFISIYYGTFQYYRGGARCPKYSSSKTVNEGSPIIDLTFQCSYGQLGNKMFYYAVVYGLSRLNNRTGYIQECNAITCSWPGGHCTKPSLDQVFELSLPVGPDLPKTETRGHEIQLHIRFPQDYNIPPDANILVGELYPMSVTHLLHVREEIRQEFRFKKSYLDHVHSVLTHAKGTRKNVTPVGVHVRRGDYLSHIQKNKKEPVPVKFFQVAMDYFRRSSPNALFVIVSDDLKWCRENLSGEDVYVAESESSAAEDLAVLSSCQHSIFDYGTYGFWGAFLAGGRAMYYVDGIIHHSTSDTIQIQRMFPPGWIGISRDVLLN